MRGFSLFLSAVVLLAGSTFARAEKPRQAPPAMTEQEIKDYIDAQVDAAVQKALSRQAAPSVVYSNQGYGRLRLPVGATAQGCPEGCTDNGDGTCSCPQGTACGSCSSCGMSQSGGDDDGGGGSCANGSCANGGKHRFLGRFFGRRRNK